MNIQDIPTNDLITELLQRFDCSCFIGRREMNDKFNIETVRRWFGRTHDAAGLCVDLQNEILGKLKNKEVEGTLE